jgi:hypothetical protein
MIKNFEAHSKTGNGDNYTYKPKIADNSNQLPDNKRKMQQSAVHLESMAMG